MSHLLFIYRGTPSMSSSYKPVSYQMTLSVQRPNFLDTDGTLLLSAYISRLKPAFGSEHTVL